MIIAEPTFIASLDGLCGFILEVESADRVVLAVGDVEGVAVEGHALGIAELGVGELAVLESFLARAGDGDLFAFQVRNHYTVIGAVRDEDAPGLDVGEDLAGERQRRGVLFLGELEVDGIFLELALERLQ